MKLISIPFECLEIFAKIHEKRKGLTLLGEINKNGVLAYRFDMLHIEFAQMNKNIGDVYLRGGRRPVNLLYSELIQLNLKFKTNWRNSQRRFIAGNAA